MYKNEIVRVYGRDCNKEVKKQLIYDWQEWWFDRRGQIIFYTFIHETRGFQICTSTTIYNDSFLMTIRDCLLMRK